LWSAAEKYLQKHRSRTVSVSEIYDIWRQPPYGLKDGLMPILAVAFALSHQGSVAFYRQGIFQPRLSDLDVEYLNMDPTDIRFRWMDLSKLSRQILSGLADVVRELDDQNALTDLTPIDVARGLVAVYDRQPPWTKRTMQLSQNALQIRQLFKKANDPNKFLFDDIPALSVSGSDVSKSKNIQALIIQIQDGLRELNSAYPTMVGRLRQCLLSELQVPNTSPQALAELRDRAENIRDIAGDFRLEAFIGRLTNYDGSDEHTEGLASLAVNKTPKDWVDPDIDRATLALAEMARNFVRAETFAHVKGRTDKRHAMAIVVGINGRSKPVMDQFEIADGDRDEVDALVDRVQKALDNSDVRRRNVVLAALAELSVRYLSTDDAEQPDQKTKAEADRNVA